MSQASGSHNSLSTVVPLVNYIGKLQFFFVLTALMKTLICRQWLIPWQVPSMTAATATPWLFPSQASAVIFH